MKQWNLYQQLRPLALCLLFLCFGALSSCTQKEEGHEEVWRFAIEEVRGSVQDAYAQKFKELIEKKSGGKIKVIIYPYGTLGTSDQILELIHQGVLEFAMASPGHLGKAIPELQFFSLHFLFSQKDRLNKKVLRSGKTVNEDIRALYKEKGFRMLSIYPEGWQVWTTNREIRKPDNFKNFKMRVMTTPLLIESYKAYGASPVPLPYSEVYSALQLKMIDGQVNPVFAIEEMSFYEPQDYLIFPKAAYFVTSAITNDKFMEKISDEKRRWVNETISELYDFIFDVQKDFNLKRLNIIKKKKPNIKTIYLSPKEREKFEKTYRKVYPTLMPMIGERGEKILKSFVQEIKELEQKSQE